MKYIKYIISIIVIILCILFLVNKASVYRVEGEEIGTLPDMTIFEEETEDSSNDRILEKEYRDEEEIIYTIPEREYHGSIEVIEQSVVTKNEQIIELESQIDSLYELLTEEDGD